MAGKRVSLASLAGAPVETVPGASRPDLIHVPPSTVAPTPLNPRRAFDETELAELGEDMRGGQLQPCVAVNKAAYLKLYPEHADQLPAGCRYVMAAGERRWRAAVKVGLEHLDLLLRHDLTESRVRFLAAVLSENVQRANFNPIEEADGLRAMLDLHDGNQAAAARAMGKSKQWFNQRIGLLRLTDQMVQLVLEGKLTAFREMRRYAAMPPEEQYAAWQADQEQPRPPKQPSVELNPGKIAGTVQQQQAYTAVYPPADTAAAASPAPVPSQPEATAAAERIPESRTAIQADTPAAQPSARRFPYDDGLSAGQLLIHKMPPAELEKVTDMLIAHREKQTAGVS
ncbi:ParB/RepB/Spo0J family partition protein [Streptomyces leeuwenhoekii]|uniref:ParB n=1 Tax=Streptomyces leeuwenhoekii TaxID=1437453 RepID=A0A0F7VPB0_STRLW|nr:ParB/RepB/Spo0J family partition protein [Streptomyces leeuwenhoekii]CQR59212.1 ParB [Streptomyces leeuwenhoekii]